MPTPAQHPLARLQPTKQPVQQPAELAPIEKVRADLLAVETDPGQPAPFRFLVGGLRTLADHIQNLYMRQSALSSNTQRRLQELDTNLSKSQSDALAALATEIQAMLAPFLSPVEAADGGQQLRATAQVPAPSAQSPTEVTAIPTPSPPPSPSPDAPQTTITARPPRAARRGGAQS